jgi:hypothetical protein
VGWEDQPAGGSEVLCIHEVLGIHEVLVILENV